MSEKWWATLSGMQLNAMGFALVGLSCERSLLEMPRASAPVQKGLSRNLRGTCRTRRSIRSQSYLL